MKDDGVQIMIVSVAIAMCVATVIIIPVVMDNLVWERVATACIEKGGTWQRVSVPGVQGSDWSCRL